jgi:hypothetical protein
MSSDNISVLSHSLRCGDTATNLARALAGPNGKQHATTLIGALMLADTVIPSLSNAAAKMQASSDIAELCAELARLHVEERAFDA